MYALTADTFSGIGFRKPVGTFLLRMPANKGPIGYEPSARQPSDNRPDILRGPTPIPANWLAAVERRIRNSIAPYDVEYIDDGRWLSHDIASAASTFFRATSDVLPSEPFIYSSRKGDLVTEFSAPHGTLTSIVSQTSLIVFAVVDGVPIEKRFELGRSGFDTLRQELQRLTKILRTGRHGAQVESPN